jgi:hypothetical protein
VQEKNKQDKNQRRKIKKNSKDQLAPSRYVVIAGMEFQRPYFWRSKLATTSYIATTGMEIQRPCFSKIRVHLGEKVLPGELRRFGTSG